MFPESYSVVFIVSIAHPNYFSPLFFLFQDPFVIKIHPKRGPSHPDLSRFPLHIISNPVAFLICPLGVSLEFALFARSGLRLCGVVIVILEARGRPLNVIIFVTPHDPTGWLIRARSQSERTTNIVPPQTIPTLMLNFRIINFSNITSLVIRLRLILFVRCRASFLFLSPRFAFLVGMTRSLVLWVCGTAFLGFRDRCFI